MDPGWWVIIGGIIALGLLIGKGKEVQADEEREKLRGVIRDELDNHREQKKSEE